MRFDDKFDEGTEMDMRKPGERKVRPKAKTEKVESPVEENDVASPRAPKGAEALRSTEVVLPSHGYTYGQSVPEGKVFVRPPKVREVDFLAEMTALNYEHQLTRMLAELIVQPDVDPWNLTDGDRTYLFIWQRAQILPTYDVSVTCPLCRFFHDRLSYDLSAIPLLSLEEKYAKPVTLDLPGGTEVTLAVPTGRDIQNSNDLQAKGIPAFRAGSAMLVKAINGRPVTIEQAAEQLGNLEGGDGIFIQQFRKLTGHGPDTDNCPFKCSKCGGEVTRRLPFRQEFFYPALHFERLLRDAIYGGSRESERNSAGAAGDQGPGDSGVHADTRAAQ